MKKTVIKKLELSKETITNLTNGDLDQVKAGFATSSCPEPESRCNTLQRCTTGCTD